MNSRSGLRLRAVDDEDLAIISACLRGALSSLGEMAYDREARRFAAILVRPRWETAPTGDDAPDAATLERMRAGLHFDHVSAVRFRRLDRDAPHTLLHLIAIVSASLSERYAIILSFEGGGEVFLEVDKIRGQMRDLDAPPLEDTTAPADQSPPAKLYEDELF